MNENSFRLMAVVIFLAGAAISTYFRRRADRQSSDGKISLRAEGLAMMLALRVAGITLWLCILAYLLNPGWMAWSQIELPVWLRLSGAALGIVADGLLYWVFTSLGNNVTPTVVTRSNHQLVTTGPYRWVRHPLYSVGFMSYMAFAILSANWFVAALAFATLALVRLRVPAEEEQLIARNAPAYRAYASRTGRFFPKMR